MEKFGEFKNDENQETPKDPYKIVQEYALEEERRMQPEIAIDKIPYSVYHPRCMEIAIKRYEEETGRKYVTIEDRQNQKQSEKIRLYKMEAYDEIRPRIESGEITELEAQKIVSEKINNRLREEEKEK